MASPLLGTKLYAPRRRDGVVPRARLTELLERGAREKLTLISAPAGFGKTTLLADWLADRPAATPSMAWLSLDPTDNDPATFWTYVIAALQSTAPGVGDGARALLEARAPIAGVLTTLLNELGEAPSQVLLVLDDYHVIEAREIHDGVAFLIDHLPSQAHLVIATRADPALPLGRLRARGDLVEIRAADLRFTTDEAAAYLNGAMGIPVTPEDVAALEARTEGWIAALQLAALSMRGRTDVAGFIAGFTGDDRYVVDYLAEEVLARQPDAIRSFLLQTSVLTRLTGTLCDALTGRHDGSATLATLDRANLFLAPLDDRRRWYRYHQLFADVLQAHLVDEQPETVPALHRRASAWFEAEGETEAAIDHAIAGGDFERAARLIERAMREMQRARKEGHLRRWLDALPRELYDARPVLAIAYVGAHMATGDTAGVEPLLEAAARWVDGEPDGRGRRTAPPGGPIVADEAELRRLPAAIAMYRAGLARIRGDLEATIQHAHQALDLAAADDPLARGGPAALIGLAHWAAGDLDAAYRWFAEGMASLERADHLPDVVGGAITLAEIRQAQGRLRDAARIFERGLAIATRPGEAVLRGAADMHVGLAAISREHNDLETARSHMAASRQLGDTNGMPQYQHRWRVAMAGLLHAEGAIDDAIGLLDEAERRYVVAYSPNVRPIAALRARVWIAQGDLAKAWAWADERGITATDDLSYGREFEHATLARLLVAQGRRDRAATVLAGAAEFIERLLAAADDGRRNGSAIDLLVVQALARHERGDLEGALGSLRRAIEIAEPEGYVRLFLDEGPAMTALLRQASKPRGAPAYLQRLLAAASGVAHGPPGRQPLIEPLSDRELEVLRLLQGDLDGPAIARELVVSLNTLRTHTKNIYAKLGVSGRRAAVRRAQELDLLARTDERRSRR